MKDFKGKIAFITGAAAGAGLGQAKVFAKEGMKVAIADIRSEALDKAALDIVDYAGCKIEDILKLPFDLTDREAYAAAADKTEEVFGGPPHLFIQTAGVNSFGPVEASTFADFDWVLGVNLGGVVNGFIIMVPRMIKAYANKTECHIAATSSMGGFGGGPTTAPYSASKAALNALIEAYYHGLKPYGIGATVLCPSNINSDIWAAELYRPEKFKESGYNTTPEVIDLLKEHVSEGIDPVELGLCLKKGIEDGILYCLPHANAYEQVARFQETKLNYLSVEGMIKEQALAEYRAKADAEMRARGEAPARNPVLFKKGSQVGFAKAREDIDWVADVNKAKK